MATRDLVLSGVRFLDALSEYNHLPPLASLTFRRTGEVLSRVDEPHVREIVRGTATWAATFDVPVRITLDDRWELVDVETSVEVGGRTLTIRASHNPSSVEFLDGAWLVNGKPVEVPAADVLDAIGQSAEAVA